LRPLLLTPRFGLAKGDPRQLNGDTVFEIGSVTKVFTSLLLMDMVQRGEIALTDPVSKFLPLIVKMPERNGKKITLADLSTQTSGLPSMPANMSPKDPVNNPYADHTVDQLYQFLSDFQLTRDIGSQYEYSNLGVGLLGHVLALRAGSSYGDLVRSRISKPLEMSSTSIALSPDMTARLAVGHNGAFELRGELGHSNARRMRRFAVHRKRSAQFLGGQPRLSENAAGCCHGRRSLDAPPYWHPGPGDRVRLAHSYRPWQFDHLA
jgi:CubicO group peptidase (beta-lactamase class C family)